MHCNNRSSFFHLSAPYASGDISVLSMFVLRILHSWFALMARHIHHASCWTSCDLVVVAFQLVMSACVIL